MTEHGAEREDCVEEKLAGNNNVAGEEEGVESGGLTRGERSLIRRFSEALRFADFMALLMVAATAFSAFATWRTAQVTNLLSIFCFRLQNVHISASSERLLTRSVRMRLG